jgi:acetyltransferase-like isoleucine patch superfamily enzyme
VSRGFDNVPRAVFDSTRNRRQRYQDLVVGQPGWGALLAYEAVTMLAGSMPGALGLALRARLFPTLLGACGRNVFFGAGVTLRHPHKIRLGSNVVIDDGCVLDAKGAANAGLTIGDGVFVGRQSILQTKDGQIVLEDNVNISSFCTIFSASTVRIGRDTLIAAYTYLVGGGHELSRTDVPVIEQPRPSRGIDVGPNGWIGAHVTVLDGVTVGHDVVIGAGAVVTKDLPDFAIAAGAPAAVLRLRTSLSPSPA